ncbi:unnamed protein product [Durusdinium trenchii]|uniref:Uncharacterized protein n=2 Tax=Durusdinium trenchii TaxID=1381693 RepID=A0ABP0HAN4_9DINO
MGCPRRGRAAALRSDVSEARRRRPQDLGAAVEGSQSKDVKPALNTSNSEGGLGRRRLPLGKDSAVGNFLSLLGIPQYSEQLLDRGLESLVLLSRLNDEELIIKTEGIPFLPGHRARLLRGVLVLREASLLSVQDSASKAREKALLSRLATRNQELADRCQHVEALLQDLQAEKERRDEKLSYVQARAEVLEVQTATQVPKEPLPAEEFTVEGTTNMLIYLTYALSDDPNFRNFWPHTVSEADAVIEQLRMIAKAVQFGSRKNKDIVQCFVDHRGLHMLVKCLLSFRTPSGIRAQGWQSLCLVLQNVKDDTFDLLIREEGAALNQLFSGKPDLSVEEHLQFFVSALKTVCMRTSVESLPYLMTEDRDLPVFRRAMAYTAYDEALVRTMARSAQLWIFPKLKQNQELLCIALDIAKSELPMLLCTLLRKNWLTMAQASQRRSDSLFRVGAECEEDVWGFLGELLSLELPEMAELISGMVVGSVMGDLSNLTSRKAGPNDWSLGFPNVEASEPMMVLPSPSAFSPSPKSTASTASSSREPTYIRMATFAASGLAGAAQAANVATPPVSSDFSMALALRTLAIYARTLRQIGIGCALMPLIELLLLPSVPSKMIDAMEQLAGGCVTEEGTIAFAEDFAARAMEDWALKPRIDDELSEEEKKVLLEQAKKRRDEYWQKELRTAAAMTGHNMVPNPFREAFLAMLDITAGVSDSLTFRANCNMNSVQSVDGKTAATFVMSELKLMYPQLLEDAKLLVHEVPVIIEDPKDSAPTSFASFAEGLTWFFQVGGNGCTFTSL